MITKDRIEKISKLFQLNGFLTEKQGKDIFEYIDQQERAIDLFMARIEQLEKENKKLEGDIDYLKFQLEN